MRRLELKLLPPVVTLLAAGGMALTAQYLPTLKFVVPEKTALCALLFLSGLLCELSGFLAFWKVRTSINPLRPAQASWMVRHGIYRFTRNPMYLGQLLQLLAWAFWLENLATFAFLPAFVAWMTRFQIIPEERILGIKFGNDYADYLNRVRRWI